jgi:hypothetical protein
MDASGRLKRVLMLCYYYPPISSAGTQRSVGFTRWLGDFGWKPIVLTVKHSRIRWEPRCEQEPSGVEIVRSFEWDLQGVLTLLAGLLNRLRDLLRLPRRPSWIYTWCLPDIQIAWLTSVKGAWLARQCDCIYVSCSPFSSALSGCLIKLATGSRWSSIFATRGPSISTRTTPPFSERSWNGWNDGRCAAATR